MEAKQKRRRKTNRRRMRSMRRKRKERRLMRRRRKSKRRGTHTQKPNMYNCDKISMENNLDPHQWRI